MTPFSIEYAYQAEVPYHIFLPRGMLTTIEHRILYLLGKEAFSARGHIVDAGAFIGSSAYCLAAGVSENRQIAAQDKTIHSYDLFVAEDDYVASAIQQYCFQDPTGPAGGSRIEVKRGFDFEEIYRFQISKYQRLIEVHKGDFNNSSWSKEKPIEILFVDIAKTQALNSKIFADFFPSLITETGILIQQDFHHVWHPYIHVSMEYIRDYFEIFVSCAGATRAYRLVRPVPAKMIDRIIAYDFSAGERIDLLTQMVDRANVNERALLQVIVCKELSDLGEKDLLIKAVQKVRELSTTEYARDYCLAQVRLVAPMYQDVV